MYFPAVLENIKLDRADSIGLVLFCSTDNFDVHIYFCMNCIILCAQLNTARDCAAVWLSNVIMFFSSNYWPMIIYKDILSMTCYQS